MFVHIWVVVDFTCSCVEEELHEGPPKIPVSVTRMPNVMLD